MRRVLRSPGGCAFCGDARASGQAAWEDLPVPDAEDAAILSWTSGTTGTPKGFLLSYRNISSNVHALCQLHIVSQDDRLLLPLPLHHAYPFVVGMLTPLAIGAPLVLPADMTGSAITQALRSGEITTVIGVPGSTRPLLA